MSVFSPTDLPAVQEKVLFPPVNTCPSSQMVSCVVAPCKFAEWDNVLHVQCFDDYCGRCNAWFFIIEVANLLYTDVTQEC